MNMSAGIIAGITWGLETVILGIALSMSPLCSTEHAIFLAPFVSTFLHDAFSAIFSAIYNGLSGNYKSLSNALFHTKTGKFVIIASLIGGPIGMTGYVLCINYMGAAVGAIASAIFPAIGAALAFVFLKEKMKWYRWILLAITLFGVYGLSYSSELNVKNFALGIAGAFMCSFGWGIEAVVLAKCLKDDEMKGEYALQIRQTTSAVAYGIVILPIIKGWSFTINLFQVNTALLFLTIALAALSATVSYLFYYKAISQIGATKAMALNITYTAWAMIFTVIIMRDTSILKPSIIACGLLVITCGILAAADINELL